jgi:hypothetical protein
MEAYKKLNWMQIGGMLREKSERTDFTWNSTNGEKFDQMEDACYAIDINMDVDLAYDAIERGLDLTDCLATAQVEFCCG